jgi:hypothetical protein
MLQIQLISNTDNLDWKGIILTAFKFLKIYAFHAYVSAFDSLMASFLSITSRTLYIQGKLQMRLA